MLIPRVTLDRFFAPDGAGGGGAGTSDGTQTGADPASAAGDPSAGSAGAATGGDPTQTPKTYSEAEVIAMKQEQFDKGHNVGFGKGADKADKKNAEKLAEQGRTDAEWAKYQQIQKEKDEAERAKLVSEGKYQELLEKERADHQQELATERQKNADLARRQDDASIAGTIRDAAAGAQVLASAQAQVAELVKGHFKMSGDHIEVVDADGFGQIDHQTGKPMTPEAFMKGFLERNPHFQAPNNPNGGSGTRQSATPALGGKAATPQEVTDKTGSQLISQGLDELNPSRKKLALQQLTGN